MRGEHMRVVRTHVPQQRIKRAAQNLPRCGVAYVSRVGRLQQCRQHRVRAFAGHAARAAWPGCQLEHCLLLLLLLLQGRLRGKESRTSAAASLQGQLSFVAAALRAAAATGMGRRKQLATAPPAASSCGSAERRQLAAAAAAARAAGRRWQLQLTAAAPAASHSRAQLCLHHCSAPVQQWRKARRNRRRHVPQEPRAAAAAAALRDNLDRVCVHRVVGLAHQAHARYLAAGPPASVNAATPRARDGHLERHDCAVALCRRQGYARRRRRRLAGIGGKPVVRQTRLGISTWRRRYHFQRAADIACCAGETAFRERGGPRTGAHGEQLAALHAHACQTDLNTLQAPPFGMLTATLAGRTLRACASSPSSSESLRRLGFG
eukprot:361082-Chlamydomonas_euryale.AAC.23